jgi:hypothetical protein
MANENVTVMPGAGIIPTPGDDIVKFNRYYIAINPNPAEGPPTWRVSDPDEYPCDGTDGLPPGLDFMVAAEAPMVVSGDDTGIEYSFSMTGVPEDGTTGKQVITTVENLDVPVLLSNTKDDPVFSIYDNNDKATVTSFNIYGLSYEEWKGGIRSMKVTVYNSDRSGFVSTSDPVQSADNVDTTDLFFDIDSLPHES